MFGLLQLQISTGETGLTATPFSKDVQCTIAVCSRPGKPASRKSKAIYLNICPARRSTRGFHCFKLILRGARNEVLSSDGLTSLIKNGPKDFFLTVAKPTKLFMF